MHLHVGERKSFGGDALGFGRDGKNKQSRDTHAYQTVPISQ